MSDGFVLVSGNMDITGFPVISGDISLVDCPECVLVISDGGRIPLVKRAAGVVINGDSTVIPPGRLSGVQLISCGRCGKNTVSISSDSGEVLTLALNRAIQTASGVCEPMELPVRRAPGSSEFSCMADFAAGLLLGKIL